MKLTLPYRGCKITDISQLFGTIQTFGGTHIGLDFAPYSGYGKCLTAPENVRIAEIVDSLALSESLEPLQRGYGLKMASMSTPNLYYVFWHCLPAFPVKVGDYVSEGKIVAFMGNSGNVYRNGVYVPLAERPITKNGTHLHFEVFTETAGVRTYLDPLPMLDFTKQPNYSIWEQLSALLKTLGKLKVA